MTSHGPARPGDRACHVDRADDASTGAVSIAGLDGGHVALRAGELRELRSRVEGPLLQPGDDEWEHAVRIWNAMAGGVPARILQPVSARDVVAGVEFAREHGLRLGIKGGGHNIAGTSMPEAGFVLDMSRMREIVVDPAARLVHAGPGCLLKDVDAATQAHGLATVLGFISEVGVAGLTLGGGLGYLTRRFGWSADNVEELQLVTADGVIRRASRNENAPLFWALRGGGGNFGVVTRFTFRLHAVGPVVHGGLIAWPFERSREILQAYQTITSTAPRELSVWMMMLRAPAAPFVAKAWHGERICAMSVCFSGDRDDAERALAPIRSLANPIFDLIEEQPYVRLQSYLDATEPKGKHYYWRTEYTTRLDDALLATLRDAAARCPIPDAELGILHIGGALNERAPDDGAVGNRDAHYVLGALGMWEPDEPAADAFRQWIRDAWARFRPFTSGGNYINFQTADESDDRIRASYGSNFDRLVDIKKTYDPGNLFRANRNVAETSRIA